MRFTKMLVVASALALCVGACGSPPPPEPPKPKPVTKKPKPKPPPPPKCESLEEDCRSEGDTMAKITISGYDFRPPEGWAYAQMKHATISQLSDDGPVLVLASFEPEKGKKAVGEQRKALLGALTELVSIELPKGKLKMEKGEQSDEVAGLKMEYWQREKAKRGGQTGSLLVLSAPAGKRALFGFGFVPDDDKSEADRKILEALQSIQEHQGDSGDKGESKKSEGSKKSSRVDQPVNPPV